MKTKGKVFLVDDDDLILTMLARALRQDGYAVETDPDGQDILDRIRTFYPDAVLLDIKLPGKTGIEILQEVKESGLDVPVVMLTSDDTAETAIKAMKLGAADYLTKPFNLDEVRIVIGKVIQKENLSREVRCLRRAHSDFHDVDLIGISPAMEEIREKATKITKAGVSTVLITGESGTGKEVLARFIHRMLHREEETEGAPYLPINCTALPEALLESELFGYEKGAFTDARTGKQGIFELANKGSILLDEIGDMKQSLQGKLLRVLEARAIRRIGSGKEIPIDVAVLATTNRDLPKAVSEGGFRVDLFYRLNAFSIHIPPLRDRKEDIPPLVRHFLSWFATRYGRKERMGISPEAEECLMAYRWPGNVRELRNVIERIVVLENIGTIRPEHLPPEVARRGGTTRVCGPDAAFVLPEEGLSLDTLEKDLIVQALGRTGNNKARAAKLLNVSYDSLRYQIRKFDLE